MIYCISDIHGMEHLFEKMLEKIDLKRGDKLYVLGDCIDRGGGLDTLRHIMELEEKGLAKFIKGNHEIMFSNNIKRHDPKMAFKLYTSYAGASNIGKTGLLGKLFKICNAGLYLTNIRDAFYSAYATSSLSDNMSYYSCVDYYGLSSSDKEKIIRYINDAPTFVDVTVSDKNYRLTHAGCNPDGSISTLIRNNFYMNENPLKDRVVVFGHTSTKDIRFLTENIVQKSSIWYDKWHGNDKIGIDCGAPFEHGRLACLRLDDMKEFYVENDMEPSDFIRQYNDYANVTGNPVILRRPGEFEKFVSAHFENKRKAPAQVIGKQIEKNIDDMSIPESTKQILKHYLKMIHNYSALVKLNPTKKEYQKYLMEYTMKAKKMCEQYGIDIETIVY